ncbi:hypothetical protein Y032_0177g616 [Ancylostoma ceylanicum]|uniref:SCP domain-containing protein n=1 Tax=Ancylostoma ceylanicum TaxID=53326 RepID=A0A016SUC7_9BILA|nr:hypothetical protein Y032_0177g616 [Ancylostoma ceylanicum]
MFRSQLALGNILKNNGKMPQASNMWKIRYNCGLEEAAIQYASTCPVESSDPSSRRGVEENFRTFPARRFKTFEEAAKKSVTEWWKVIRSSGYFTDKSVVFRPFHKQEPISSFTRVAWAATKNVGCSIVKCTTDDRYVSVCRYTPSGNIVGESIYKIGPYCSSNPGTTQSCDKNTGLWP